jgi:acetyl esterase/lipase
MVEGVRIELDSTPPVLTPEDFICTNCYSDLGATVPISGVKTVEADGNILRLTTDPFLYRIDFAVECISSALTVKITKDSADGVEVFHEEIFRPIVENGVRYRLYEPECFAPRPLVLFLHGGDGCGEDNMRQLTDTIGAIKLAERLTDMYVMAPQAPSGGISPEEMFARMQAKGNPFQVVVGADPNNGKNDQGWNREYLGRVCDVIRKMIKEGKVDASRVYAIGMSMGGCGVLKAVSAAPDLFAACVPICPSMNGESYPILENFPDVPTYIASAYIDHQTARHAYLLRGVQKLWDKGRRDVRITLFTPEELKEYGIGITPNLSMKDLYTENHYSWILVLHNEYGILDWMLSHCRH